MLVNITTTLQRLGNSVHQALFRGVLALVEREVVPDFLATVPTDALQSNKQGFVDELKSMAIALQTDKANEQHYELPTEYFCTVLGRWRKYSCCLYRTLSDSLDEAEENMLELYCDQLALQDGGSVLDLGCGWGSFTLYAAARYPRCSFTAVSNSQTQNKYITGEAALMKLANVAVITADMNDFQCKEQYDKVISIEMFEHMKNYQQTSQDSFQRGISSQELLRRVASWMKPGARFFCHTFCHHTLPYHFEDKGDDDWMTRHFFSGGTMPSLDLFLYFQDHLQVHKVTYLNGMHYSRCLEAWLKLQDKQRAALAPLFQDTYGRDAKKWFVYWRLFYMACSELFRYKRGNEWGVMHYVFEKAR